MTGILRGKSEELRPSDTALLIKQDVVMSENKC
jgi:hypothetical protein